MDDGSPNHLLGLIDKYKVPMGLSTIGLVLIIGGLITSGFKKQVVTYPKESLVQSSKQISVDVSGAVNKAGVYKLDSEARIEQAIQAAGGLTLNANQEFVSKYLNLAQKLSDGTKIYVPSKDESVSAVASQASAVNINTASESELDSLTGVGPTTASKIIAGRPYQTNDELVSKKIISKTAFDKIKEQIVVY